jgi:predicted nucleic acid-binding protein
VNTTLVDAGPIVALFDADEPTHERCRVAIEGAGGPLLTCEAAIAEACWLLRRFRGAQRELLLDVADGRYMIDYQLAARADQVARLVSKYANVPMSLADACLVDLADIHQTGRILTLDADFGVYRWGRNKAFELLLDE